MAYFYNFFIRQPYPCALTLISTDKLGKSYQLNWLPFIQRANAIF